MKKSLIALAALAATSAFAQSSVTIYGTLDVGFGKLKGGQFGMNNGVNYIVPQSQSTTALGHHLAKTYSTASNLGFRGVEDLGGGMKATFNLQTGGLDLSNGDNALQFGREANLGLETTMGNFKVGRSVSTATNVIASGGFDLNGISAASPTNVILINPAAWYGSSRRSNQLEYTLPQLAPGLVARVSYIAKGDANADHTFSAAAGFTGTSTLGGTATTAANYKDRVAVGINYSAGPLNLGAALETPDNDLKTKRNAVFLGARYNAGVVIVSAMYAQTAVKGGNTSSSGSNLLGGANSIGTSVFHSTAPASVGKGMGVGVAVPLGALTLGAQYASNTENDTKANELFANYSLSKRTTLYASAGRTSGVIARVADTVPSPVTNALRLGAIPANPSLYSFGIRHTF